AHGRGPAGVLGGAGLPQRRGPVAGGALPVRVRARPPGAAAAPAGVAPGDRSREVADMIRDEAEKLSARLQERLDQGTSGGSGVAAAVEVTSKRVEFAAPGGARPTV